MRKLNPLISVITALIILHSCTTNKIVSNGAFSDISLTRNSDQYEIKRLPEITTEGKSFWGIPIDNKVGNKSGIVVRFNGVDIYGTKRIFPILTMIVTSAVLGTGIREIVGKKTVISIIITIRTPPILMNIN